MLPGRNPVLVAKELASLDRLSGGRLLPAFGLGVRRSPAEQQAFGVERRSGRPGSTRPSPCCAGCGPRTTSTTTASASDVDGMTVPPEARSSSPSTCGSAAGSPSELRRVGRLGDGWLPSFVRRRGRRRDGRRHRTGGRGARPGHRPRALRRPRRLRARRGARRLRRGRASAAPVTRPDARSSRRASTACAGRSSRSSTSGRPSSSCCPIVEPDDWDAELAELAAELKPLET